MEIIGTENENVMSGTLTLIFLPRKVDYKNV